MIDVILTDSKSTVEIIKNIKMGNAIPPSLIDLVSLLLELETLGKRVHIQWIPSHVGIQGNERIDQIVKHATLSGPIDESYASTFSDLNTKYDDWAKQEWQEQFLADTAEVGRWTRSIFGSVPPKPWFDRIKNFDIRTITTINRILLGHGNTPHFKFLMRKRTNADCPYCALPDPACCDLYHILRDCEKTSSALKACIEPLSDIVEFLKLNSTNPDQLRKIGDALQQSNIDV
ncbi:RnaseH [Nesidiocoris tenuis]|uniref:RnaseH n=1 Tax=Nesidiocoris tenuis TaxID=355587 RepID=A0ABN7AHS0_9HEMI|nr:RnaseH [Nesidiocoris tenuis]